MIETSVSSCTIGEEEGVVKDVVPTRLCLHLLHLPHVPAKTSTPTIATTSTHEVQQGWFREQRRGGQEPVEEENVGGVLSLDSHGNGNIEDMGSTRLASMCVCLCDDRKEKEKKNKKKRELRGGVEGRMEEEVCEREVGGRG